MMKGFFDGLVSAHMMELNGNRVSAKARNTGRTAK